VQTGAEASDLRAPAVRASGAAMQTGPSAVERARAGIGNAAVTAAMNGSPPGVGPGWAGQMMLAGQDLIGNQAVAAQAGALPTAQQPTAALQPIPAQHQPRVQQQPPKKPEPGRKPEAKPVRKAKVPPAPRPDQKDMKGTTGRPDKGAPKKEAARPRTPGAVGGVAGGVADRRVERVSLAGPQRLSLPSFARRFNAPPTLPPLRADAADRDALARASQAFARLVERSRRAHDVQLLLLERLGRAALNRHDQVDARTRSRVAGAEGELDDLRLQTLETVDTAYQEGIVGLARALRRSRGLVATASSGALRRVRSNAGTAGDQITAIVNELASRYTDLLEQSAVEITTAAGEAISATRDYGASASTLFRGGATPLVEAQNEARRKAVPSLAKAAEALLSEASTTQSEAYRGQIDVVRGQFNESELTEALAKRKSEIGTKGRAAVEKATRAAYDALNEQSSNGRKALRRMAGDARKSIESRHTAARTRLINEANGLLHSSYAQADAELTGLKTAAKTGLPVFEHTIASVYGGLEQAAENGADSLRRSAEKAAEDTGPKTDQLAVAQQRLVTQADASTGTSVAEAERAAVLAAGRARVEAAGALRETGRSSARGIGDFVHGHDASFAATARGVRQVADAWATPLAQVFGKAIRETKAAMTGPFTAWKTSTDNQRKDYIGGAFTPYLDPAAKLAGSLNAAATEVTTNLETRASSLVGAFSGMGTEEADVSKALRGLTPTQARALSWVFERDHSISLDTALLDELSGANLESARAYLRGDQAAGATAELEASTHWYNDEEERIEDLMRNLTPDELKQLTRSEEGAEALADVRDNLGGTDLKVFDALVVGNQNLADAYRMKDKIDEARQTGDLDAIHNTLIEYGKAPTERGRIPVTADERRVAVQQELVGIIGDTGPDTAAISPQEAAAAVEKYALAPIEVVTAGPEGTTQVETREITGANRDLAVALIHGGENSVDARAARLAVETQRPGGPDMLKLDAALVDPRLKPGASVPEEERKKALDERYQVFQKYAAAYGGADQAGTVASAQSYLEGRLSAAYGDDKDAGDLAVRLAHEQYPSPETAALAVKYATKGAGTDEELMFRFVERMDRDEIAAMRVSYKNLTGTALDDDLGTFGGEGMFTELSGDDRLRMEVALLGVPRNDREAAEVAAFRIQQQRDETGWLGTWLADGSLADESLASAKSRLDATLGGATVRVDDHGNPVWTDAAGRTITPGGSAFDRTTGNYAGNDPIEFASAVHASKLAAENYAAQIDTYAGYLTTTIMVIGAVAAAVATVATGGAASPLLLAAIAGLTGLSSMAVHRAVSGGRYGWEQAAVDLGMTAVQALTAGVGQHLSIVARGGTQSLAAGMTTLRSAKGLADTMGGITGSALGDLLVIGAATGGLGGFGGALLDEATWSKGFGSGFAALLEGTLTGALAGAASTVTSQAFESLPVGRAVAGGSRPRLGDALSDSTVVRTALRGTSSFLGGATGKGVELGVGSATGRFHGDAGDILAEMGKAGLESAVQDSAAGPVEGPIQRARQARNLRGAAGHEPVSGTGDRPGRMPHGPQRDGPGRPPSLEDLTGPLTTLPTSPDPLAQPPVPRGAMADGPEPSTADHPAGASGTAGAVDSRFRGDAVEPTAANTHDVQRQIETDTPAHLVGRGARQFEGDVHSEPPPPPLRITLDHRDSPSIAVEITVTGTPAAALDGRVPVARYERVQADDGSVYYKVEVSSGADPRYVERALAHEFAEIRAHAAGTRTDQHALERNSNLTSLSAHDRGRLAEFEVIARQLENHGRLAAAADAPDQSADIARLHDDAARLAEHLGLFGQTGASGRATRRAENALRNLESGSPAHRLLKAIVGDSDSAPVGAGPDHPLHVRDNPFFRAWIGGRQPSPADLAGQLALALRMNDVHLVDAVVGDFRRMLLEAGDLAVTGRGPARRFEVLAEAEGAALRSALEGKYRSEHADIADILGRALTSVRRSPALTGREVHTLDRDAPTPGWESRFLEGEAVSRHDLLLDTPESRRWVGTRQLSTRLRARLANVMAPLLGLSKTKVDTWLKRYDKITRNASETLGMLAGTKYAEEVLHLSDPIVFTNRQGGTSQGSGLPDLLYEGPNGSIVVIECKGGDAELGTRQAYDDASIRVQQGRYEYLESLAVAMSRSPQLDRKEYGRKLLLALETLDRNPEQVKYYYVRQPVDAEGHLMPPKVGTFDLSIRGPRNVQ
jgi:hypothetical protein